MISDIRLPLAFCVFISGGRKVPGDDIIFCVHLCVYICVRVCACMHACVCGDQRDVTLTSSPSALARGSWCVWPELC